MSSREEVEGTKDIQGFYGLSPEVVRRLATSSPQAVHHEMLECPIQRGADGGLILSRMSDIGELCRRRDIAGPGAGPGATESTHGAARPMIPLELDGPEHTRYRRMLDPWFAPKRMALLEPVIRKLADDLIDGFIDDGHADAYSAFCEILPATVFLRLVGLPVSDYDDLTAFKNSTIRHDVTETRAETELRWRAAAARFHDLMTERIDQHRSGHYASGNGNDDDLISSLLTVELDGHPLTNETIIDICHLLVLAGLDTVAASLSLDLCWLARHPVERRRLTDHPDEWSTAVEELLRFETVIPASHRHALADIDFHGVSIPAGTSLTMLWAAANLDPSMHVDPLAVDLGRSPNVHATFALGFHRCLGSHLARVELRVALDQFHRRIPDYEIEPDAKLVYESVPIRLVSPLPLRW